MNANVRVRTGSVLRMTVAGLCVACVTSVACGTARRSEPLRGPLTLDEKAARGRSVFMANCQACHPGGEAGLGPALNDKPLPGFLKRFQVRHGLGAMPGFPEARISDTQLDELMAYLGALRRHSGAPDRRRTTHAISDTATESTTQ